MNRPLSIDFNKLAKPFTAIVPILGKSFLLNKKSYTVDSEDGWWCVEISGNKVKVVDAHYWVDVPSNSVSGYTCNNSLIFSNFDVAKRKWKLEVQAPLLFNTVETFSPVKAVVWEDKRVYYISPWYEDFKGLEVKEAFYQETPIDNVKGVTPELRTVHVFHALEREQVRAMLAKEEHEKQMADVGYRLKHTFERSGATLLNYSRSGNRLIVDWTIKDGSYTYNSVLNADTLQVIEAGYCLNGGDTRLNPTSLILTAEEFESEGLTYITRR